MTLRCAQPLCLSAVRLRASVAASSPSCTIAHLHVPVLHSCCVPQGRPTQGLLVILHRHCLSCVPCLQATSDLVAYVLMLPAAKGVSCCRDCSLKGTPSATHLQQAECLQVVTAPSLH